MTDTPETDLDTSSRPTYLEDMQYRLTLEGLADADAGRVFDHHLVKAWTDSLSEATPLP